MSNNSKLSQMSKDALEVYALQLFKSEWEAMGFATHIPLGGDKMPRKAYAATVAAVTVRVMKEQEAPAGEAVFLILNTVLGNASQLGGKLLKEGFLKEEAPAVAADALLEALRKRIGG